MNRIIYIMGVAASGKTTVGKLLSQKINLPFFDADDFHSQHNKQKMKEGIALTDADRQDWLLQINSIALQHQQLQGAIIACSALKEKYRIVLANGLSKPTWIFLQGSYDTILQRIKSRKNHFMPPQLLASQFASLQIPVNALAISIEKNPQEIVALIAKYLKENNS